MSNRARSDIRMFASGIGIHPNVRIVCQTIFASYVRVYCSISVKIIIIMKDEGFVDENVGWMCLLSTAEQSLKI